MAKKLFLLIIFLHSHIHINTHSCSTSKHWILKDTKNSHHLQPLLTHSSTTRNHFLLFVGKKRLIRSNLGFCNQIGLSFSLQDSRIKPLGVLLQDQGFIWKFLRKYCQFGFGRVKALKNRDSCKGVAIIRRSIERLGTRFLNLDSTVWRLWRT